MKLEEISIELTHSCPNFCRFCSSNSYLPFEEPERIPKEMRTMMIMKLMKEAKESGASILSLSGGEPSIHSDIFDILKYAGDLGYVVFYYTSGARYDGIEKQQLIPLGDNFIKKIKDLTNGKLKMIFDIQGCEEKEVDYLMGVDGAFERLTDSMIFCSKEGITMEGHFVPMNRNIKRIYETIDFCEGNNISKLSFLRGVPQGRMIENNLMPNPRQFRDCIHILMNLYDDHKNKKRDIAVRAGHPISNYFALFDNDYNFAPCRGGSDAPLVTPDGHCDMCPAWKDLKEYNAGNIINEGFEKIWKESKFYVEFRKYVNEGWKEIRGFCAECPFLSRCKGGCTAQRIYYAGKGLPIEQALKSSPDPLCPYYNNFI